MDLQTIEYPEGNDQIGLTLSMCRQMIEFWSKNPNIVRLAREITRDAEMSEDETETVRKWVFENITYKRDVYGHEWLQDPIVTLSEKFGDCDDMTVLCGALLAAIGHNCIPGAVTWEGQDSPTHAILLDNSTGFIVDAIISNTVGEWPPMGYKAKHIRTF